MSHLARIQPECLRDVVDYLGTETFMIHEDAQGQYVRISQNRWQWMQGLLAEAMFGKQPREGDKWPLYLTATIRVGDAYRNEWVNAGVLVYDGRAEGRPLVAYRLTEDLDDVNARARLSWLPLTTEALMGYVEGYSSWELVQRGGYPGSYIQVHQQGASVRTDPNEVCEEFYRILVASETFDDAATEPDYDEVEGGMRWVEEHTSVDPRSGENVTTPAQWAFVDRTKGGDA